jgi:hypothetical protein
MPAKRHSKESIICTLQSLAANLGKNTLSKSDVQQVVPLSSINNYFVCLGNALEAAGLQRTSPTEHLNAVRCALSEDELFRSIREVEDKLGHEPGANEYRAEGRYSTTPFKDRYGGKWSVAIAAYQAWKKCRALTDEPVAVLSAAASRNGLAHHGARVGYPLKTTESTLPVQFYGEPFDFRGLRHAPINEQGVVYLFGMISRELGFYVESIQQGFPDCEAKYLYDQKRNLWAKARIEFEFRASSFKQHGHDATQCDFIVCWINDWGDCPIRVIDLKNELLKLSPK